MELLACAPIVALEDAFAKDDVFTALKLKERLDLEMIKVAEAAENDAGGAPSGDQMLSLQPVGGDSECVLQLVGDLVCESAEDIEKYDDSRTVNTLALTLRKGKTVSGCLALAAKAKAHGCAVMVASETECGETDEAFSAHFAVGIRAGQFKAGGLFGIEHAAKYTALVKLGAGDKAAGWIGPNFRSSAA